MVVEQEVVAVVVVVVAVVVVVVVVATRRCRGTVASYLAATQGTLWQILDCVVHCW